MRQHDVFQHISQLQGDYLAKYPFSNISVALSFIEHAKEVTSNPANINLLQTWNPNSLEMLYKFGGTNCIGASLYLLNQICHEIPEATPDLIITPSERLPQGVSKFDVPYQHAALKVTHPIMQNSMLVDPGLSIPEPIPLQIGSQIRVDYTLYSIEKGEVNERLIVTKPSGKIRTYDLIKVNKDIDLENAVQKPLFTVTNEYKIEQYQRDGKLKASIKVNLYKQTIKVNIGNQEFLLPISSTSLSSSPITHLQSVLDDPILPEKLSTLVEPSNQNILRSIWHKALQQRQVNERLPEKITTNHSSWQELEEMGYKGGGVAIVFVNKSGQILMYQIPAHKAKPHIGRFAGMLNLFTENAEYIDNLHTVANLETFDANLRRALFEELGLNIIPGHLQYFETDYLGNSLDKYRARIAVILTEHDLIQKVIPKSNEIGQPKWVNIQQLNQEIIDPNAWNILTQLKEYKVI